MVGTLDLNVRVIVGSVICIETSLLSPDYLNTGLEERMHILWDSMVVSLVCEMV
jgi:hypothetical protein